MNRWCSGLALWWPLIAHAQTTIPSQASPSAPLVLRGVTVIDVRTGQRLPDQSVVIAGTRIQAVRAKAPVPAGARVVDARGRYLIPGMWDMHVHVERSPDIAFPLFLANGVTGVRDAGSSVPLATLGAWKRAIVAGTRAGPRYLISGPALDEKIHDRDSSRGDWYNRRWVLVAPADARRVVDSLRAAGADFLKLYMMSRALYLKMAAEARRAGLRFGGHHGDIDGLEASDSGATFLDHETWIGTCGDGEAKVKQPFDATRCGQAMRRLRQNNTWVTVPASEIFRGIISRAKPYVPSSFPNNPRDPASMWRTGELTAAEPISMAEWAAVYAHDSSDIRSHFAEQLAAGLPVVVGTDVNFIPMPMYYGIPAGFSVPRALVFFVLGGMTPLEALQTVTLNPALALRATDSLGTVAAGKVADLLILDADPLVDVWNVTKLRGVVANGRYYDRAALDTLLAQAARAAAQQ